MKKYTNTNRDKTVSEFAQVLPGFDGTVATFKAATVTPTIVGKVVPMVRAEIRLAQPSAVDPCSDSLCPGTVTQAVKIDFNIKRGDIASLTALVEEAKRLMDVAVAGYNLADGIVPPVSAEFAAE